MVTLTERFAPAWQKEVWKAVDIGHLAKEVSTPFNDPRLLLSFSRLALSLGPHLISYDTVLGDDASGRIPALLIARWARKKRADVGLTNPNLYFIHPVPGYSHHYAPFEAFLKSRQEKIKHVLFVTEYIQSGTHANNIVEILSEHNIKSDVAALSLTDAPSKYPFGEHLFYGDIEENSGLRAFRGKTELTGVFSDPMEITVIAKSGGDITTKIKQKVRTDAVTVADALYPLAA